MSTAALNVSSHAFRVDQATREDEFLPVLVEATARISERLARR